MFVHVVYDLWESWSLCWFSIVLVIALIQSCLLCDYSWKHCDILEFQDIKMQTVDDTLHTQTQSIDMNL